MRVQTSWPYCDSSRSVVAGSSHFGLPIFDAQLVLRVAELDDLAVRDLERLEELVLVHLLRARLDHRQAVLRADDDQVEVGVLALPAASG